MFEGKVIDAIDLRERGTMLNVLLIRGVPREGGRLVVNNKQGTVVALDGKGIVTNGCLDGAPLPPQMGILVDLPKGDCPRDAIVTQHMTFGDDKA